MTSNEIRQKFLTFFEKRGHKIIPSASLVPENDSSTLFISAGMQPLVPYLLGEAHPAGNRLADCQKCVRTVDIDEVGDNRHNTFFEMLGNWSLGDYFKKESIPWSFEFLTNPEEGLGLDPARFYITVFGGEDNIPRDEESIKIWQEIFAKHNIKAEVANQDTIIKNGVRIIPLGKDDNFWIAGATGPCGGDTEMFYDTRPEDGPIVGRFQELVDSFRLIEVWNNVFMEFNKTPDGQYEPLSKKNVDTGMGLERTTAVVNNQATVFDTDLFATLMSFLKEQSLTYDERAARIVADHLRAAIFMIADGVSPSNTDRGYVLRRLLRRAKYYLGQLSGEEKGMSSLVEYIMPVYKDVYPELDKQKKKIIETINNEEDAFMANLGFGQKLLDKIVAQDKRVSGDNAFLLYSSYGYPFELILDMAKEYGVSVDVEDFEKKKKEHQELSRQQATQKFKGGLGGDSEKIVKYHTATHLLQQALADVLGPGVAQKGSNITEDRLRFDFTFDRKMTDEEKKKVEEIVNAKIAANLPMKKEVLPREEAEKTGARHLFNEKYGDQVSLYYIGDSLATAYSKEFCGGPHVESTGSLGHFKIMKEEAVAAGVRRIKAVLE